MSLLHYPQFEQLIIPYQDLGRLGFTQFALTLAKKEDNYMKTCKRMVALLWLLMIFSLCSCGIKDNTGIIKNLLKNDALVADYSDPANMNNYLRGMSGYTGRPTFVFDGQDVYFEDAANYYTLKEGDDFVTYLPRQVTPYTTLDEIESVIHGIIVNGVLYNEEQNTIYSANKDDEMTAWQIVVENDDALYVVSNILPYAGNFYFTLNGILYRCKGEALEHVGTADKVEIFQTEKVEQVFNETDVYRFGIFSDTVVVIGDDDQIWTIDLSSNEAVCIFEGNDFYDGGCCVDNGYIYYVVDCNEGGKGSLERIKFDGTGRETELLTINDDVLMDYIFNASGGNLYFLQYSKLNDEYFLCTAPLSNLSVQTTLAHGIGHGIDGWISELYPNGEWVYYATEDMGFWRAKTDGTLVEKIQEFNIENKSENMDLFSIGVAAKASDFAFEQYELLPGSDPNMVGGYCGAELEGKNASWKLEDGILTISGRGDMQDLNSCDDQPWANVRFDVTSIIVEEGITSIGNKCFRNLSNVTDVSLPTSLVRIGKDAFLFTSLEQIHLPDNLEVIEEGAVSNLTSLTGELFLPNSITEIGRAAFYGCSGLTGTLKLPASLTTLGEMAFKDCSGFTGELMIPSGVEAVAQGAFSSCYHLSGTLTLSEGVKIVEQNAFYGCSQIETINLPSTVERIKSTSFSQCSSVQSVLCHGSLDSISYRNLPRGIRIEYVD